jgi:hypothetical protein
MVMESGEHFTIIQTCGEFLIPADRSTFTKGRKGEVGADCMASHSVQQVRTGQNGKT